MMNRTIICPGRGIHELHVLDLEIDVAVVAVEVRQRVLVLLELIVLEVAAAGEPGKHPMLAGLDHLPQLLLREGLAPTNSTWTILIFGLSVISKVAVARPVLSST